MGLEKAAGALAAFSFVLAGCACGLTVGERARLDVALAPFGFEHCRCASADQPAGHRTPRSGGPEQSKGFGAAEHFPLHAWLRPAAQETLTVIIEGDGASWFNPRWPPSDPTPEYSQAAALARTLPGAVAYLGRPCQFEPSPPCRIEHWTSARFSGELVAALDGALDDLKRTSGATRLRLVGHSGGGVMAVLLAQRRSDVVAVVTLMAPLALDAWTRRLGVSALIGDDPLRLPALAVPAFHIAGGRDAIVPPDVVRTYVEAKGGTYMLWPEAEHACWPLDRARDLIGSLP